MLDDSLSAEVPETIAYKTALLSMLTTGKVETEASYEYVLLQADIYMNKYKQDAYQKQIKFIEKGITNLSENIGKNEFEENLLLSTRELKLDLFLHFIDYCDSSFYYNLKPCIARKEFSFDATLPELLQISNKLVLESFEHYNDLYPPPQPFHHIALTYKEVLALGAAIGILACCKSA